MAGARIPSLFDIQVNGFAGVDFRDPEINDGQLRFACQELARHHVHRFLLTLTTDAIDSLSRQFAAIEGIRSRDKLAAEAVVGYHLEGPYLSPEEGYVGAHPREFVKAPEIDEFERLQESANGQIRLLTLAPEWPGSSRFIEQVRARGVHVSIGHSNAGTKDVDAVVKAGARFSTHLGNAVPQHLHRHQNIVQELLSRDELFGCFIPDGIHLPPHVLRNFVRAKANRRTILVSDCVSAAGAPPGRYVSCGRVIEVGHDRIVRHPGMPNFAGSALSLDTGVANAMDWLGVSFEKAWAWASTAPAEALGVRLPLIPRPTTIPAPDWNGKPPADAQRDARPKIPEDH